MEVGNAIPHKWIDLEIWLSFCREHTNFMNLPNRRRSAICDREENSTWSWIEKFSKHRTSSRPQHVHSNDKTAM